MCLPVYLSSLTIHPPIYLLVQLPIHPPSHPPIYLPIYLSIYPVLPNSMVMQTGRNQLLSKSVSLFWETRGGFLKNPQRTLGGYFKEQQTMIQFQPFLLLLLEWDSHVCVNTQREVSWGISRVLTTPHPQNEEGKTHVPEACFCLPGNCNLQLKIKAKSCINREN